MEKLWAYLIHLGENMWYDRTEIHDTPWVDWDDAPIYREKLLCDDNVWDEVVAALPGFGVNTLLIDLGDGIKYESHPELAIEGSWSKEKLADKLARARAAGLEVLPKLNFSACHDAWLKDYSRMVSSPDYYRVTSDLIAETCELFDSPRLFHLGMDEETPMHQAQYAYAVCRHGDLWWHDLFGFADACANAGARAWVWSDYYWDHPDEFAAKMPKEIMQSNWDYNTGLRVNEDGTFGSGADDRAFVGLDRLGYDQIPTGSNWSNRFNMETLVSACEKTLDPSRVAGYMMAPWALTTKKSLYTLLDGASRLSDAKKLVIE